MAKPTGRLIGLLLQPSLVTLRGRSMSRRYRGVKYRRTLSPSEKLPEPTLCVQYLVQRRNGELCVMQRQQSLQSRYGIFCKYPFARLVGQFKRCLDRIFSHLEMLNRFASVAVLLQKPGHICSPDQFVKQMPASMSPTADGKCEVVGQGLFLCRCLVHR